MAKPQRPAIFKWRHFTPEVILCAVRWYLRYSLSYRDVQELLVERGLEVAHTTSWRWVQHYAPELEERTRAQLKPTNKSWRVDETYVSDRTCGPRKLRKKLSPLFSERLLSAREVFRGCGSRAAGSTSIERSTRERRSISFSRPFVLPRRPRRCLPRRWQTLLTLSPGSSTRTKPSAMRLRFLNRRKRESYDGVAVIGRFNT
jgi:hypothetical protein